MGPNILIGATLTTFAMQREELWSSWLKNQQPYNYFAAIQLDERGILPFLPLRDQLTARRGEFWEYKLNDGRKSVTATNRYPHIAAGRNMIFDYACARDYDYVLMMDADTRLEEDTIPKLLDVADAGFSVVGAHCTTYNQSGMRVMGAPGDTRYQLATGCTLIQRRVFERIRYRGAGLFQDDWGFKVDCKDHLDVLHVVRHDARVKHYPEDIVPIENRGFNVEVL